MPTTKKLRLAPRPARSSPKSRSLNSKTFGKIGCVCTIQVVLPTRLTRRRLTTDSRARLISRERTKISNYCARSRTIRMISFSHRVGAVWTSAMPPRPSIYGGYWRHYRSRSWRRGNRSLSCTRAPMTHFTNSASNNQTCWTRSQRNN